MHSLFRITIDQEGFLINCSKIVEFARDNERIEIVEKYTKVIEEVKQEREKSEKLEEIKEKMRHHWNPHNMREIGEMMSDFRRLGRLLKRQFRYADADKMRDIGKVISKTYDEIETILRR